MQSSCQLSNTLFYNDKKFLREQIRVTRTQLCWECVRDCSVSRQFCLRRMHSWVGKSEFIDNRPMSAILTPAKSRFARLIVDQRRWVIILMLLCLHFALLAEAAGNYQRVLLLVHFGLFLLWQPFVSPNREMTALGVGLLLGLIMSVLVTLSGWMLAMWGAILIGIMGGKVFTLQAQRRGRFYLVAVFYLFAMLLVWTVPVFLLKMSGLPQGLRVLAVYFLPSALLLMIWLPFAPDERDNVQIFDFFYSLIVFQLVIVLVLGGIAAMRITGYDYFVSVLLMLIVFAVALLVLALVWGQRSGFGGLASYFSRYLMSVGMPFELWMRRVAELSEGEMSSGRFLQSAMDEIAKVPWILGGHWQSPDGEGSFGAETKHTADFTYNSLSIRFFAGTPLSPALFLHVRLLAQVVGEFYEGKRREQAMKQNAYMQAVHETGARLTHDIKNVLQSLYALTSATVTHEETVEKPAVDRRRRDQYDDMLARQLPRLTQRLQTTLDKLQNPAIGAVARTMAAQDWWLDVTQRHQAENLIMEAEGTMAAPLPAALFDTVLENCVENARKKRDTDLVITVKLTAGPAPALTITDTGAPIPPTAVAELFRAPVMRTRQGGLGIGLYQAHKQAEQMGYALRVASNEPGAVTFALAKFSRALDNPAVESTVASPPSPQTPHGY